jgi:serine/threonine protein kinase
MVVATGQSFGNFQVVRLLGEGGFGEVYEAENPFLQRRAAIKIMHTGMDQDPELVRRFLNEARAASAIRHPNIIDVFDAGVTADGEPYILMEFLEGDSLQKVIQQAPMPLETVLEVARQAGSALGAAHQAGIVHRDLKPENLHLIPDAGSPLGFRVKVLDFGIAKIKHRDEQGSTLKTRAGLLMGSPSYMSPEQCRDSSDVDLRSDIYSFGIIVYEMLTGVPPFVSQSATEMLVMQITADPPPLRDRLPNLPEHVEQAVMRALAKDREKRFTTVDYFVGALQGNYPAFTVVGSSPTAVLPADLPPGQSMSFYAAQGFGHKKTPTPVLVSGFASRVGMTPLPMSLPNQTITTLTQARGEAVSPSPELSIHAELDAVRPRRWPWALGLLGVAAAAVLFFAFRPHGASPARPGPAAPTAAVAKPPAPPPSIRIELRSTPAGATVFKTSDGTVLGMTPLNRSYPQGQGTMDVLLRLRGYKDKTVTVKLEGSSAMVVDLERIETVAGPTAAPARRTGRVRKPPRIKQDKEEEWLVH